MIYSTNSSPDVFLLCIVIWIRLSLPNFIKFYLNSNYFFSSNGILLISISTQSHSSLVFKGNYVLSRWYFALSYINSISKSYCRQRSCLGLHFKMQMQQMNFSIFSQILFSWKGLQDCPILPHMSHCHMTCSQSI